MEEKFEEIDKFISETAKKTSTKSYKLSPFKTEIEYMYKKNIPQVLIIKFLFENRNLKVSKDGLSQFIKRNFKTEKSKKPVSKTQKSPLKETEKRAKNNETDEEKKQALLEEFKVNSPAYQANLREEARKKNKDKE